MRLESLFVSLEIPEKDLAPNVRTICIRIKTETRRDSLFITLKLIYFKLFLSCNCLGLLI